MRIFMRRIVLRSATRAGLTRRDYWLAAGAAEVPLRVPSCAFTTG
jgi:hypothetical protein